MASSSGCDLAHLLTPVLLLEGWWLGVAVFKGGSPHHRKGPLWVSGRSSWVQFFRGRAETRVLPVLPCPGLCIINGRRLWTWFGTFTHTCTAPQGMVVGTCHLQGRQPLPWGRSPVSFRQISLSLVFQGKSWDKGPSSLALPRIVHHQWFAAPNMIWHIYSHLYCSSRDGGRDLPSSGEAAPTMGQVPSDFWADRPTFIFQPAAPDVIWHIYSHLYCSLRDGGR